MNLLIVFRVTIVGKIRDGQWDLDPMGFVSRDSSPWDRLTFFGT